MQGQEEGFLRLVEEEDRTGMLVYADWLEEQGREEEAEFWRWVIAGEYSPDIDEDPLFYKLSGNRDEWIRQGGILDFSLTWWDVRLFRRDLVGKDIIHYLIMEGIPYWGKSGVSSHYREFPTRVAAYRGLFEGWRKVCLTKK